MGNKNLRRLGCLVTAPTLYNLELGGRRWRNG